MFIYSHKNKNNGPIKKLSKALDIKRITPESLISPTTELGINWGVCEYSPEITTILNPTHAVIKAAFKDLSFIFLNLSNVPTVDFTLSKDQALTWVKDGKKVFCRTKLTAKRGDGIVIATKPEELVDCKLYTLEYRKSLEFRVHVFKGQVIDYVQKRRRKNSETPNGLIRNYDNGWVFCHYDIIDSPIVRDIAVSAVTTLGLDFGAVDILAKTGGTNQVKDAVVCEINTAPALRSPTTFNAYVQAFKSI